VEPKASKEKGVNKKTDSNLAPLPLFKKVEQNIPLRKV